MIHEIPREKGMFTFIRREEIGFLNPGHIKNKQYQYSCGSVCFMNMRGRLNKTFIEMLSEIINNITSKH